MVWDAVVVVDGWGVCSAKRMEGRERETPRGDVEGWWCGGWLGEAKARVTVVLVGEATVSGEKKRGQRERDAEREGEGEGWWCGGLVEASEVVGDGGRLMVEQR